jgi:glycerophosphoryl diester phosphodiesterase
MKDLLSQHNSWLARPAASVGIIAHRGGAALMPENTLAAFSHAAKLGVDAFELDIHASADGTILVSHDPTVDRMTDGSGAIVALTDAELRKLDAAYWWSPAPRPAGAPDGGSGDRQPDGGSGDRESPTVYPRRGQGDRIPLLRELFERFPQTPMVIDIKQRHPDITKPFADLIRSFQREPMTLVGSFHKDTLRAFRRLAPEVPTCLYPGEVRRLYFSSRLGVSVPVPVRGEVASVPPKSGSRTVVTERFVSAAHRRGVAVSVWTINRPAEAERLAALGVDSIVTDAPDLLTYLRNC